MEDKRIEIRRIIKNPGSIPTLPGIITKLNTLAATGSSSTQDIARVISSDQVLSAKVLRLFMVFPVGCPLYPML
jgi:HD-like signal output (HDOD) protein